MASRSALVLEKLAVSGHGLIDVPAFVASLPIPASYALDQEAGEVGINAAFAACLGIEASSYRSYVTDPNPGSYRLEIEGRPMLPDEAPLRRAALGERVEGQPLDIVRSDGTRVNLYGWASSFVASDGTWLGSIAVFQDVTARVEAEARASELAELTPVLAFRVEPNGSIAFVNSRFSELCGVSRELLVGNGWKKFVFAEDLPAVEASWKRSFDSGTPFSAEWRMQRADGSYGWLAAQAVPVPDAGGRVRAWFGAAFDVDDQHRTLAAMRQLESASATISSDIDVPTLVADLSRTATQLEFADLCVIDVREADGTGSRTISVAEGRDPRAADFVNVSLGDGMDVRVATGDELRDSPLSALVVAPLRSSGRTFGSIAMLRLRPRRPFAEVGTRAIEAIGQRAGVAIEKIRLNEVASRQSADREAEFRNLADIMPQLMWTADALGRMEWYSERWYEYTGLRHEQSPYNGDDVYHPDDVAAIDAFWAISQATGEPFEMEYRIRGRDGTFRWYLSRARCMRDAAGHIVRWYGSDTDVDDVRRLTRSLASLAALGRALSESLGLDATLQVAMETFVPEFADWAYVTLVDDAGDLRLAATYHRDERKRNRLNRYVGHVYAGADAPTGTALVARNGKSYLLRTVDYPTAASSIEPELLGPMWETGFGSLVVVPLLIGTTVRGTLNLVMHESARMFSREDVELFEELARRVGPAIANAEVYERERRVAQSFQQAALPAELPNREGYRFSAIYEAGKAEALVGGDWYDAFTIADGRIVVSIGDVAGSGLQAAITMSNMRQSIRAVAQVHAEPALMLAAADRTLRSESPDRFVTAFVGVIDPVSRAFSYAGAGHHPPLVRTNDGTILEIFAPGLPLGLRENDRGVTRATTLPEDAFIVMYTDGLIESTHDADEGERRLRAALADPTTVTADYPAAAIRDAVLIEGSRDDVAILTVTMGAPPDLAIWSFDARDGESASTARREIGERLREAGHPRERVVEAELVISELIGNTVRYAPGPIDVMLERVAERPIVHVLDRGPGFEFSAKLPPDIFSESGRGLFLIAALAEDLSVVLRPDGGSHARVLLLL